MEPKLYIGTGGWQYFIVPGRDPLKEYSRIFDFVEVNSTFYQDIPIETVRSWRRRVPPQFKFSVRAHKTVSHKYLLKPTPEALRAMERTIEIADTLDSDIIVIETPKHLEITRDRIKEFMERVGVSDKYIAIEARGGVTKEAMEYMKRDDRIIPIYDISRGDPPYHHKEISYTRVFGSGRHNIYQFTNDELRRIYRKATNAPVKMVLISFHGVRMYTDAGKLRYYYLYKDFPRNKPPYGIEAVKAELMKDMKFPASREEIIRHEGWKVVPLDEKRDIHLGDILSWLPPGTYKNVDDVIEKLEKHWPPALKK